MELKDLRLQQPLRRIGCSSRMPVASCVRRVVELVGVGDKIGTVVRVFVVIKGQNGILGEKLRPGIAFILRLPQGRVFQPNEDSLQKRSDVAMVTSRELTVESLKYACWTIGLGKSNYGSVRILERL